MCGGAEGAERLLREAWEAGPISRPRWWPEPLGRLSSFCSAPSPSVQDALTALGPTVPAFRDPGMWTQGALTAPAIRG